MGGIRRFDPRARLRARALFFIVFPLVWPACHSVARVRKLLRDIIAPVKPTCGEHSAA